MTLFTDGDMGDYAEKVLAYLVAEQLFFTYQTRETLNAALRAEGDLFKLSRAILHQLGRTTRRPTDEPTLFEYLSAATPPNHQPKLSY